MKDKKSGGTRFKTQVVTNSSIIGCAEQIKSREKNQYKLSHMKERWDLRSPVTPWTLPTTVEPVLEKDSEETTKQTEAEVGDDEAEVTKEATEQ